jgi:hypothetical protein
MSHVEAGTKRRGRGADDPKRRPNNFPMSPSPHPQTIMQVTAPCGDLEVCLITLLHLCRVFN